MKDLKRLLVASGIAPDTIDLIIIEGRREFGGDKMYWPQIDSRKDSARAEAIRAAAKRLPTGVVAERFGVSRGYVYKVSKKR